MPGEGARLAVTRQWVLASTEDLALGRRGMELPAYGRYPDFGGGLTPMTDQDGKALREAEAVLEFVLQRLPAEANR